MSVANQNGNASLLDRNRSQLLVVDIQEKLIGTIHQVDAMIERAHLVIKAARVLDIPITISEQYPKGLGPTDAGLREACGNAAPIFAKTAFSCVRDPALADHLAADDKRRQLLIVGMEAHVCILQTALDAQASGYEVFVAGDAISSRQASDVELAKQRMIHAGIKMISAEMVFFEWLERAGTADFKALAPLLK